jgi:hypothetical protein
MTTVTMRQALTRGWQRLDPELQIAIDPNSVGRAVTKRLGEGMLMPVLRLTDPALKPLVTRFVRNLEEADAARVTQGVVDAEGYLKGLVPVIVLMREAMRRAGPRGDTQAMYGMALDWHKARPLPPAPDECEALYRARADGDAALSPPRHAAFRAMLADPVRVDHLQTLIDAAWADTAPGRAGGHEDVDSPAETAYLTAATKTDEDALWNAYVEARPWRRLLGRLRSVGLSEQDLPTRPVVLGPVGAGGPPLDRSLRARLTKDAFKSDGAPEEFSALSTREVAERGADAAGRPLGLATDDARAALWLGLQTIVGITPDAVEQSAVTVAQRRVRKMTEAARKYAYVRRSLALGDAQTPEVREALQNPHGPYARRLWPRLHHNELRHGRTGHDGWVTLVQRAAESMLRDLSGKVAASLEPPAEGDPLTPDQLVFLQAVLAYGARELSGDYVAHLERFISPAQASWARGEWRRLTASYLAATASTDGTPDWTGPPDPAGMPTFEQARTYVRRHFDRGAK